MNVLVDTSVWSLALRRKSNVLSREQSLVVTELRELISEQRAQLIGPVRQELLTGVRILQQYGSLRSHLRAFHDTELSFADYEDAAAFSDTCLAKGISGSSIDFLISAVAIRRKWALFSQDRDFELFARHIPLLLHSVRQRL